MKNKIWIIVCIVIALILGVGTFLYFNNNSKPNENNYQADRTSTSNNETNNSTENNTTKEIKKGITETKEEQLSTFSTKIYSSDSSRQHNIQLTCDRLNGTIVKNGDTFSFYAILGPSTAEKGYLEADILDNKGKKQKGFGRRKLSN